MSDVQPFAFDRHPSGTTVNTSPDTSEIQRLHLRIFSLSAENARLRSTVSYQLGGALLRAKTFQGLKDLPRELVRIASLSAERRGLRRPNHANLPSLDILLRRLLGPRHDASAELIIDAVDAEAMTDVQKAALLAEVTNVVRLADPVKALLLARHAVTLDPSPSRRTALAGLLVDSGAIEEPHAIYTDLIARRGPTTASTVHRAALLEGMLRVRDGGLAIPSRGTALAPKDARSILYVAASTAVYHTTGYTARTQSLVKAVAERDWRVHVASRPGYPWDRNDIHHSPTAGEANDVGGVIYHPLPGPKSNATPFDRYCSQSARSLVGHIGKVRPAIVHAASNYLNAAPALMAAKRAGLPFVYEVRGLWELTQASKTPGFEDTERFAWQRQQETRVASASDLVLTISDGLRRELIARGVDERRIRLAPNCVNAEVFRPAVGRDETLARSLSLGDSKVLGFIGSMMAYEGLVDLVSVLATLRGKGLDVCAVLVGDGPAAMEIREAARAMGVAGHVIMPGRVPHAEAPRWYSLMDVAVYPRRPSRLTELVPPLKPLEAMAMEKPVVASDVAAIQEAIVDGRNGFLFRRGDIDHLARRLEDALQDGDQARRIAKRARADILDRFTWDGVAARLETDYLDLLSPNRS